MSFSEIAEQRHLGSVASHLGDPRLVGLLLDRLDSRPIERALIAWDVAAGSLLGPGDAALAQRLRTELAPLKRVGTSASVAVPRDRVGALIAAVAGSSGLGSVAALTAGDTAGIAAAFAFCDRLALAHLPSLALAYAQILWTQLALPEALDRLVEVGLDFERFDSIPPMIEQDGRSMQRQTYFGKRVALVSCELRYQSFDPEAWRALAVFLDDGAAIAGELQQRSLAQLAAAVA